ncbi:MAG: class I SAM-dependent methyltransferase, partial [Acidimicrobiales bacterium]
EFFVPALFGQWTGRVLDAAAVEPDSRILDVGCGTGILARAAVMRVGRDGAVDGLDPNLGMLSVADRACPDVAWHPGVAEALPFGDATFDRVVSQFAAMFFSDRGLAVDEMARVLQPEGRVAIATWGVLEQAPGYAAMVELLEEVVDKSAADALRAPFVLGDPQDLRDILSPTFSAIDVVEHNGVARFESIDAWVHTEIRGWTLADRIDDDCYQTLRNEARTKMQRFTRPDGSVEFPAPALIATASR